ncbi:MAG: 4-hydroxy-tetrahydrodipicolinate synthase [Candidatus Latescibacteria bacterium]|nr:4-hydroxy-tetrahydrodipicolinate synthase [Candidatus Latescibacterota bacterium]
MLTGSIVALVTPFRDGQIDETGLRRLLRMHLEHETDGIVPCGTTGEAVTLSHEEYERVIAITVEEVGGRIPVIAGAGTNDTAKTIAMSRYAQSAGVDGLLIVTPYYNRPTQRGLVAHYRAIAASTNLPIIMYNVPSRTGTNLLPETVAELAQVDQIVGIKEASGNLDQVSAIVHRCGDGFTVLSGDDSLTLPILAVGGKGVISVTANIAPREVARMVRAFREGNSAEARRLHNHLFPVSRALFVETNPGPVKAALALMGLISGEMRLPLVPPSDANLRLIRETIDQAGLLAGTEQAA